MHFLIEGEQVKQKEVEFLNFWEVYLNNLMTFAFQDLNCFVQSPLIWFRRTGVL